MKVFNLKNVIWKEGKYYVAQCLNFEVSSFGRTKKEAIFNLNEAVDLFLEDQPKFKLAKIEKPEIVTRSLHCVNA
ncbi:MAG: type II toxin-antitoxin system HicB family antitoxin [Candidatus Vogelbacteria bacterium]|nr:type II toxin-antitoxin system HicB family antitoxin [Candidatus Vogelbacteria bacterium]